MRLANGSRRFVRGRSSKPRVRRLFGEGLELRALLAGVTCDLTDGLLNIWGTLGDDQIAVQMAHDSKSIVVADRGQVIERFAASDVRSVCIQANSGNDRIAIDALLLAGASVDGGDGEDVLLQLHSDADAESIAHHHHLAGARLTAVEQIYAVRQVDAEGEDETLDPLVISQLDSTVRDLQQTHFDHGPLPTSLLNGTELHQPADIFLASMASQVENEALADWSSSHQAKTELNLVAGDDTSNSAREHDTADKSCMTASTLALAVPGQNQVGQATGRRGNVAVSDKGLSLGTVVPGFIDGPRLFDEVIERFLNRTETESGAPMANPDFSDYSPAALDQFHRLGVTLFVVGSVMFFVNLLPRRLLEDQQLALTYANINRFSLPRR